MWVWRMVENTFDSDGISFRSVLDDFEYATRATSRSFLPHSSVFVARKMQAAATSWKGDYRISAMVDSIPADGNHACCISYRTDGTTSQR